MRFGIMFANTMSRVDGGAAAAAHDRDPEAIEITAGTPGVFGDDPIGAVEELASIGVRRISVPSFALRKPNPAAAMEAFAERVVRPATTTPA